MMTLTDVDRLNIFRCCILRCTGKTLGSPQMRCCNTVFIYYRSCKFSCETW